MLGIATDVDRAGNSSRLGVRVTDGYATNYHVIPSFISVSETEKVL